MYTITADNRTIKGISSYGQAMAIARILASVTVYGIARVYNGRCLIRTYDAGRRSAWESTNH